MTRPRIAVDEGGLRHEAEGERRYVPFASIADVELRTRLLRDPVIVLALAGASEDELELFAGGESLEIHRELVAHLQGRRDRAVVATPTSWRRGGQPLLEWLSAIRATTDGVYRDGGATRTVALAVAHAADEDVDARAVAVDLLIRSPEDVDLTRVAKILASRPLPPLVQVAAYLAPGGRAFITDDLFAEAFSFLPLPDREEVSGILDDAGGLDGRHVAAAAEAKRELEEEARHHASIAPRARSRNVSAGDRETSRWIGRSWGL